MTWRPLILVACALLALAATACDKKKNPATGLIGHWKVAEQQRDDKCRFTAGELAIYPDGEIKLSNMPQSEMRYLTDIAPDHFERLKQKYPNIEQGSTVVIVAKVQPKNQPMMGMAYRYALKDKDTLMLEYAGCRPTAYKRVQ